MYDLLVKVLASNNVIGNLESLCNMTLTSPIVDEYSPNIAIGTRLISCFDISCNICPRLIENLSNSINLILAVAGTPSQFAKEATNWLIVGNCHRKRVVNIE